jgi:hypothetical protein
MLGPSSPLDFIEALARERQTDPRLAAMRSALDTPRRPSPRTRLARAIVRMGEWLDGRSFEPTPTPSLPSR